MLRFLMVPFILSLALTGPVRAAELTADQQARVDARCQKNPDACERIRARAAELKSKCEADPKACEAKKAELRANGEAQGRVRRRPEALRGTKSPVERAPGAAPHKA